MQKKLESSKNKSFLTALLLSTLFIIFKWNDLYFPYFWDEAWSYAPAIQAMLDNSPCLLPNCIEPNLYRGHPLLFYFSASLWGKVFGASLFSMHVFALTVSLLTAFSFYRLVSYFLGKTSGSIALGLLFIQAAFFVQSSYVLPEILVGLCTLEMVLAYLKNKKWTFFIWGSLLLLTKESGFAILAALYLFHFIKKVKNPKQLFKDVFWLLSPLIPISAFFIYQKIVLGWFLYPLHVGMIDLKIESILVKLEIIFKFLFLDQGRWLFWCILSFAISIKYLAKNKIYAGIGFILTVMGCVGKYQGVNLFQYLFFLPIALFLIPLYKKELRFSTLLIPIIFFSYIIFCSINFMMLRYLMCILPFVILFFLFVLKKLELQKWVYSIVIVLLLTNFSYTIIENRQKTWIDDVTMNDRDMISVHQEVVKYCEDNHWQNKHVSTHFLMTFNLKDEIMGYLNDKEFKNVEECDPKDIINQNTEIVIISAIEYYNYNYTTVQNNPDFVLQKRFESNQAWSEIYIKIK